MEIDQYCVDGILGLAVISHKKGDIENYLYFLNYAYSIAKKDMPPLLILLLA